MSIKLWISLMVVGLLFQGCLRTIANYNNVPVQNQMDRSAVKNAINSATQTNGWRTKDIRPGLMEAEIWWNASKHMAKVNIGYSARTYTITYADSKNLNYNGKNYIHSGYNSYVNLLKKEIDKQLKLAGGGLPVQNYASSPSASAPVAVVGAASAFPYTFKAATKPKPDSFALVIGINRYQQNTSVDYADRSALAFAELANKTIGIPQENIMVLTNEEATSGQLKAKVELLKELADSRGNLYVYFAGHGVPGKDGSTYILPYDMSADSIHLEPNLKLDNIYAKLSKLKVKKVFIFMDSCFSGKDDKGGLLYRGVAPVLKSKKTVIRGNKLTIVTAGKSTDFANDFKSKEQRMFSYYLINELSQGETNLNKVYPEIKSKVRRSSLMKGIGYKQVPQIYGNKRQKLY
ncbi:MAG: caspase family protein [Campylobacterota bacterium]|nr:caspase family protein [Campylobacterota bacterium]